MKNAENSNFKRFGLVGKEISYSFSPAYFKRKFEHENIQASYKLFDIPSIVHFPEIFMTGNLSGLNVTRPYKEEVMLFIDEISDAAKEIGAVNTIQIKGQHLIGHNTDWIGFKQALEPWLKTSHQKALILGTGGAAKAVSYALKQMHIPYTCVSRIPGKADLIYSDLTEKVLSTHQIIINTTPVGTFPEVEEKPDIPFEFLSPEHITFDLIYNPEKTKFLQLAEDQGSVTLNGQRMLEIQAEEAWKIWNHL